MAIKKIDNRSRYEIIYEEIKEEIINNRMKVNEKLDLTKLSKKFGVSRSPIVTAVTFLERDGYLSVVPQKGTFVRGYSKDELSAMFDVHLSLSLLVIPYAIEKSTKEKLGEFRKRLETFLPEAEKREAHLILDYYKTESEFHAYLIDCTPEILRHMAQNILDLTKRIRLRSFEDVGAEDDLIWLKDDIQAHIKMTEGLLTKDEQTVRHIMEQDIADTKKRMLGYLQKLPDKLL